MGSSPNVLGIVNVSSPLPALVTGESGSVLEDTIATAFGPLGTLFSNLYGVVASNTTGSLWSGITGTVSPSAKGSLVTTEAAGLVGTGIDPATAQAQAQSDVTDALLAANADPSLVDPNGYLGDLESILVIGVIFAIGYLILQALILKKEVLG